MSIKTELEVLESLQVMVETLQSNARISTVKSALQNIADKIEIECFKVKHKGPRTFNG